jgi:hypothetical protein
MKWQETAENSIMRSPIMYNLQQIFVGEGGRDVAHMGEMRNAHKILVGMSEAKKPLGGPRRRWEDNIKMDLWKTGLKVVNGFAWLSTGTADGLL